MKFLAQDEGGLPGVDEILSEHTGESLSEGELSQVEQALAESRYPMEATMSLRSNLWAILDRLRGRRLLYELPEEVQAMTWLELHVPTNGMAALTSSQAISAEHTVELAFFGSGFGGGRKVKLLFEETSDERRDCVQSVVRVRVKPAVYQVRGEEAVVLNVTGVAGEAIEPFPACPYCGIEAESIDRFEHRLEPFLDLRKETVGHQRVYSVESVKDLKMKIGVSIPQLPDSKLGLAANLSSTLTWKIRYGFKPGLLYQPYWRIIGIPPHSPMWAVGV